MGNALVPNFQDIPEAPTVIQSATVVPATATQPEYCDVTGYVAPQVKFQLKLPTTTWQGRYIQFGCGGFCGSISGTTFPACRTELGGDFAIAATNDGHDAGGTDALWATSEQARIDFGYRGVHVVSVAAKAIQTAYYGIAPTTSYFVGCSDGGREGMVESQFYPEDFDGIIAGAPANNMSTDPIYLAWGVKANTDKSGAAILTPSKLAPLHDAVVKSCDSNDGVVGDGLIGDPRGCGFDPGAIQCPGADGPQCLTAAQVEVVRTLYTGIFDSHGQRLDPRWSPKGSELSWAGWWVPLPPAAGSPAGTPDQSAARAFGESAARWLSYPIGEGKILDEVQLTRRDFNEQIKSYEYYDAMNTNLEPFRRAGGKLMFYQGWADPLNPPSQMLEYYSEMRSDMGGQDAIDRFVRLFMINGMAHCGGGPTPNTSDMILQLVRWVEDDAAPDAILTTDKDPSGAVRQRPVFKYPLVPQYVGPDPRQDPSGPNTAANFVPVQPTQTLQEDVRWVGDYLLRPSAPRK